MLNQYFVPYTPYSGEKKFHEHKGLFFLWIVSQESHCCRRTAVICVIMVVACSLSSFLILQLHSCLPFRHFGLFSSDHFTGFRKLKVPYKVTTSFCRKQCTFCLLTTSSIKNYKTCGAKFQSFSIFEYVCDRRFVIFLSLPLSLYVGLTFCLSSSSSSFNRCVECSSSLSITTIGS